MPINKIKMMYLHLKVFGKPPQKRTPFTLNTLTDFINTHHFQVTSANLLGDKQSKAMLVVAKKLKQQIGSLIMRGINIYTMSVCSHSRM